MSKIVQLIDNRDRIHANVRAFYYLCSLRKTQLCD